MAKSGKRPTIREEEKLWQFASDALDFCGDGVWMQFLSKMKEIGYSEDEVNEMTDTINSRAGRS